MTTRLTPYLNFRGQAAEAMDFYRSVLGGDLNVMTFASMGGMGVPEAEAENVMHSDLVVSDGVALMASDVPSTMEGDFPFGTVSISGDDTALLTGWWEGLCVGATVHVPLAKAPWGDSFGQLADRFGVTWMFNVGSADSAG